jgi:hypothetical protein
MHKKTINQLLILANRLDESGLYKKSDQVIGDLIKLAEKKFNNAHIDVVGGRIRISFYGVGAVQPQIEFRNQNGELFSSIQEAMAYAKRFSLEEPEVHIKPQLSLFEQAPQRPKLLDEPNSTEMSPKTKSILDLIYKYRELKDKDNE